MTAAACLFVQHGAACGSATVADMDYGAARRTRGADEASLTIEQLRGDFAGLPLMWFAVLYATPVGCARGIMVDLATARWQLQATPD
jgi:hypothetical protein